MQKIKIGEYWNELQFSFLGHVILDGLKIWEFCVWLSCCLLLTESLYLTWIKRQHWNLVRGILRAIEYHLALEWLLEEPGLEGLLQLWDPINSSGLELWETFSYHGQRISCGSSLAFGFLGHTCKQQKSKATQKLYDFISFSDICRIFVSYFLCGKIALIQLSWFL